MIIEDIHSFHMSSFYFHMYLIFFLCEFFRKFQIFIEFLFHKNYFIVGFNFLKLFINELLFIKYI